MSASFSSLRPLDGGPLSPVTATVLEEIPSLVGRARAAQKAWSELALSGRIRAVAKLKDRILSAGPRIATLIHDEVGKPEVEALLGEVLGSSDVVTYWCESIREMLEEGEVELDPLSYPGKEGVITREARGVIAVIMPWNFPFALPLRTIVPALLAGNAVVFKPSEVSPRTGELIGELLKDIVPEGLFSVILGGRDAGEKLCQADVDSVVFTGSVGAGRRVAHACAEKLIPCSLELGGKDAAIVLADAQLDRTAQGIVWGAMLNAGQNCASIERVYVERAIADKLISKITDITKGLRPALDVGPLTTETQRRLVSAQVDQARSQGAEVLVGGTDGAEGYMYMPTVLRVTSDELDVCRDETFGPVIPIRVIENVEEGIALANASRYGLTASLWTKNIRKAKHLAPKLRAGVVTINNHSFTGALPNAPWSGFGDTGYGITGSPLCLDHLTRPRFVLADRSGGRELYWYPYTDVLKKIALSLITLKNGSAGIFAKIAALFALLVALPKRNFEK